MLINLSVWAKIMKIFALHVNAHQRVTSTAEDFSSQTDRMDMHIQWIPGRLLPKLLVSFLSGFMNEMAMIAGMEVFASVCKHGFPFTKADLRTVTAECPVCQ